jgi:sucrose-6-phosphate hydrolase SacC (GH32 family)
MSRLYAELHRPQFHFTAKQNWLNDPNGLVYCDGVWHLFFQHNPNAPIWGDMTWGHAVSRDLLHWEQLEHALHPDAMGSMFSGSAVVDHDDTAGFGAGTLLAFYTAAGAAVKPARPFTQCLAYSLDKGRHWTKFVDNPVVDWIEGDNRDPKVIWHSASQQWIMALYLADDRYALLASKNARQWQKIQELALPGDTECPDMFSLCDESGAERWIFWSASGRYLLGTFDGAKFSSETEMQVCERGFNGYAAQTWSNAPDGRCVQISWMAGGLYPEMPFNQQLSIPVELKLKGAGAETVLTRQPVTEFHALRGRAVTLENIRISPGEPFIADTRAKLFDVSFKVSRGSSKALYLMVRGQVLAFDWATGCVKFEKGRPHKLGLVEESVDLRSSVASDARLSVRLIVDVTSLEIFVNDGETSASFCYLPDGHVDPLIFYGSGDEQTLEQFELYELKSVFE